LLAVAAGLIAVARRAHWPRGLPFGNSVLIGLGLFVAPAGLVFLADGWVPGLARTALFTLVPVFTLVFEPYAGGGLDRQSHGALLAALASVAGALRVFPVALPASSEAALALCAVILAAACVAAANCKAVVVATELVSKSTSAMAAIAGATAAVAFAAVSAVMERPIWNWETLAPELLWSAVVEVPALLLLFWLMSRMSATRMATRYVIAPLLAILIGATLMRSALVPRTWLGLLSMAGGAAYLLLAPAAKAESIGLSLH
jgi:drug/metabolite transporter (DMT)-like permease